MPRSYFRTEARERELEEERRAEGGRPGGSKTGAAAPAGAGTSSRGTVGAVALDRAGHLAAATSTGGLGNKLPGRVGDSPLIGAGTFASTQCAVSGTGQGEYFIRGVVAHDICALAEYGHVTLAAAVREVIQERLKRAGGEGGAIALDAAGNIVMEFNSVGMFRGARDSRGRREVAMYRDGKGG